MVYKSLNVQDNSRILLFTDLHAHEYRRFNTPGPNGYGMRLEWIVTALTCILNYAYYNNITQIFFLGDLFHHRTLLHSIVFDKIAEVLSYWYSKGINFHFILGNHDYIYNSSTSPSIITRLGTVDVVDSPTIYTLPESFDCQICCSPFRFDPLEQERDILALNSYCTTNNNILLGHLELSGVKVNDEYILSKSLSSNMFFNTEFSHIFTGHIHTRQILNIVTPTQKQIRIEYVGTPLQHTFNEEDKDYGFTIFDCATQDIQYINLSSLYSFPEYKTISFYTQQDVDEFLAVTPPLKLQLHYYKFKGYSTELKLDKLYNSVKFYTYEYVRDTKTVKSTNFDTYRFNLDFNKYLQLFIQQSSNSNDYSWVDIDEALPILDDICQKGNICLK